MKNENRMEWCGRRLRYFMAEKDLQPKDMKDKVKVKYKRFAAYMEGRAEPPLLVFKRICEALQISTDSFLEGIPEQEMG